MRVESSSEDEVSVLSAVHSLSVPSDRLAAVRVARVTHQMGWAQVTSHMTWMVDHMINPMSSTSQLVFQCQLALSMSQVQLVYQRMSPVSTWPWSSPLGPHSCRREYGVAVVVCV